MRYETVPIDQINVGERFRKDMGDIASLAASIKVRGQLQPIIVDYAYNLAAGERRLRAIQMLGWSTVEVKIVDLDGLLVEHDENEFRKDFTVSERVAIAQAIEEKMKDILPSHERRDEVAQASGFGNRETLRQAEKIVFEGEREVIDAVDAGTLSISDAAKVIDATPSEQRRVVNAVASGEARTAAHALKDRNKQRDPSGKLWPRNLLPVVEAAKHLNAFRTTVASLIDMGQDMSQGPMGTFIYWGPLIASLKSVHQACLNARFGYVCPWCNGSGGECKPCKGQGWVTVEIWKQSPDGHDEGGDSGRW